MLEESWRVCRLSRYIRAVALDIWTPGDTWRHLVLSQLGEGVALAAGGASPGVTIGAQDGPPTETDGAQMTRVNGRKLRNAALERLSPRLALSCS